MGRFPVVAGKEVDLELRIATYNIHKGESIHHRPIIEELKLAISSLDADIVFLQEVQGRHDQKKQLFAPEWCHKGQDEYLADMTQYSAYGKNAVYEYGHHGNALLSVYPIIGQSNTDVSDHSLEQRGILHCEIQAGKIKIYCYVVHLGLFKGSRIRQTQALIETVNRTAPSGAPVIIAGDFNDWQVNLSDMLRQGLAVSEVFDGQENSSLLGRLIGKREWNTPAKTFPAMCPFFRLDRIYTRGFTIKNARVMQGAPWNWLSDHAPLMASVEIGI